MQRMTEILRNPAAVLKKDVKFSHTELLDCCREGLYGDTRSIIVRYALEDISHVRGLDYQVKVLGKKMNTESWSPLLHAIYNGHVDIVEFMCKEFGQGPVE